IAALVLGFDRTGLLFDRGQLPIERLARQEIFERRRLGTQVVTDICLLAKKGPGCAERLPRSLQIAKPRFRESLFELHGPFDGVLDGSMRSVERCNRVILRPAEDGLNLADGA